MKEDKLKLLEIVYRDALGICDPVDYLRRQKVLLHCIAECLLEDIFEEEEKERKSTAEALEKFFDLKDKKND